MSNQARNNPKPEPKSDRYPGSSAHGGLYDRHGPIPVPEAKESDTDSAWALFEESRLLQDNPKPAPKFEDTKVDPADFEPADFGESAYAPTDAAPLKP